MKRSLLTLLIMVLGVGSANILAQDIPFKFGVRAGLNAPNVAGDVDHSKINVGYYAGLTVEYDFAKDWFVESGVDFSVKGFQQKAKTQYDWAKNSTKAKSMYINIPIHIGYRLDSHPVAVSMSAGGFLAVGVGGNIKSADLNGMDLPDNGGIVENGKMDYFGKKSLVRRFDAGLGVKIAAEYQGFDLHCGYDLGLVNTAKKIYEGGENMGRPSLRTRNFYVGLGYKF